ncbi:TPA: valine--tRNA ligase [Patescibacteria group bacterium]|nr:valine--tRNA ligase [Patescibacteria group bacterium]
MEELPKTYNPKDTEEKIYKLWEDAKAFEPKIGSRSTVDGQRPFVIAIPPPNVTGSLHMGHALNNTIQDILIRRSRMKGVPTLWIPGTDHAGIATQNVVEKKLAKEGKNRHEMGREAFEKEVWAWVDEYGHIIIDQLKKLGCSCDWSRQRFTMDEGYSEAVKTAFKHYYDKGWIYQGERVINWCVRCQTALSDIEVEHLDQKGKLYFFKYDKNFPISIATTRPETKLGDTAVAVNPEDKRYAEFVGKTFKVNFVGVEREIKIIADPNIDMKFGTGAVGVTPAHSLIDYEMAEKNGLPIIKVIDTLGKMTAEAGKEYEGLKAVEASQKVLDRLEQKGLIEKTEEIDNALSVCYRCNRPVEPQPSKQWFLKMSELAKPAIEAVEKGEIKFSPPRWKKVYLDWMENLKDWCISRQIWWGHQLPVWEVEIKDQRSKIKNTIYVGDNPPEGYKQVDDVLDTWFSSALWPFAALGWPQNERHPESSDEGSLSLSENRHSSEILRSTQNDEINDLDYFYPTTTLSTARDIIYLWVARMIFSGYEFTGKKPFDNVYIHPTVFNKDGQRMSKSLGTGVDPIELIDKYGADATRFGLAYINTGTQDIKFDENAILASQKFCNKLWNIARFVMIQMGHPEQSEGSGSLSANPASAGDSSLTLRMTPKTSPSLKLRAASDADKKILDSLDHLIISVNSNLDSFRFGQAAHDLYDFVWHDFADIYIEESKKQADDNTKAILLSTLTQSLKLLHPFMPFVTEEIWQTLYEQKLVAEKLLINASWPEHKSK